MYLAEVNMEQQQKVTSTYSEDEMEQNIACFPIAGYMNTRVLVKEIHKERQKICLLEKEKETVLSESELVRESISKCDEDTRLFHEQRERSNEICDSHKKNNEVLEKHIFELVHALSLETQNECKNKKFYDQVSSAYQDKWQEYFTMYSKHPLFQQYEEAKRRHIELQEYLKSFESQLRQLQADVFRIKCERSRKNSDENKFFPLQNFVVWIAQLRHDTMHVEKEIQETFRDCTGFKAKLEQLRSDIQKKKSALEFAKSTSDQMKQKGNVQLGHYEQRANAECRNLGHFFPPPRPPTSQPRHKFTFFIPKLTSVTSLSDDIFSSQQSNAHTRSIPVCPDTDGKTETSSYFHQITSPTAAMLRIPPKRTTEKVPTAIALSSQETSAFRASFYTSPYDSKPTINALKNDDENISSTKENVGCKTENKCSTNFTTPDNFASSVSSSNHYPSNTRENASVEIKKESKVSPYFLGTPKLAVNIAIPCSSSSAINQDSPSNEWNRNADNTVDPTGLCSSRTSMSATTSPSSRVFSPFDIKKHIETLEEMNKSPGFGYTSRSMYTVGGGNDKTADNTNKNSPASEKHEVMGSEMFCSSLFHTRSATVSPRVGQEHTFNVEKLCDSPLATASTEKSLFTFEATAQTRPTRSSVFSLFGDDDTETPSATAGTSDFLFNFRPSQEEKTESSSFKFLF